MGKMTEFVQCQKFAYGSGIGRGKKGRKYFGDMICGKRSIDFNCVHFALSEAQFFLLIDVRYTVKLSAI